MLRQEIKKIIKEAVFTANLAESEFTIEHPESEAYGDYATNVVLKIAKTIKMSPMRIAENLRPRILHFGADLFEKVEIKEPGFINFFISKEYLQKQVGEILKRKESFGQLKMGEGQRVSIEYVSANPTGPLHIGNGRNAFSGDALASVLEKAGFKVIREYFVNDAKNSKQIMELGKTAIGKGETYKTPYLVHLLEKFKVNSKTESEAGYKLAQIIQKDTLDFLEKKLKIKFDKWVSEEQDIYRKKKIEKILDWLKKNNLVYQKDGAWWLKSSKFGDEKDWVVVRETGEPTYLLSDIVYHKDKFDRGFDKVIDIWGADHQAHVSKMKAAAKMLDFKGSLDILVLQLVTLRGGEKMSKRLGNIITLEELVDEIGLDVARWFYLQKSLGTHTEIDLELAKEQSEKNPVYCVQYASARIHSILAKSKIQNPKFKNSELLNHPSELNLIKQLIRLPEIVEDTANDYQVQRLPQYAMDLATSFHRFYHDCQVLTDNRSLSGVRLALVSAARIVLKNTLLLMGISAPEKM